MPWKECAPMDEKLLFIADHLRGGAPLSELCRRYGISRKTAYKWVERYRQLCIADRLIVPVGPATAFLQSIHAQLAVTLNRLVGRLAADAVAPAQLAQRRTTAQVVGYEEQFLVHGCALLPGHGDRSLAAVGSSCQAWICYPCPCTDVSPMSVSRTGRLL